jgi:2-polyprenyl-3-methyl-5-hydroxy-6-metoxy-1,4-benzoquinol methylase
MNSDYWNNVYKTKNEKEVSWFQETPVTSLRLIQEFNLSEESSIIDIGGGESRLVDQLLELNFSDITVLDISEAALEKVKDRLKSNSKEIKFVVTDVTKFSPSQQYDLWHDRAAFHFLTEFEDIKQYIDLVSTSIKPHGHLIISTFSKTGPDKCSGLPISKYSHDELIKLFSDKFNHVNHFYETHETPWASKQDFVFCTFVKKE